MDIYIASCTTEKTDINGKFEKNNGKQIAVNSGTVIIGQLGVEKTGGGFQHILC